MPRIRLFDATTLVTKPFMHFLEIPTNQDPATVLAGSPTWFAASGNGDGDGDEDGRVTNLVYCLREWGWGWGWGWQDHQPGVLLP